MTPASNIKKFLLYLALISAFLGAIYLMKILNRTICLKIHPAVYAGLIILTAAFMGVRFRHLKAARKSASVYASESLAAIGFLILTSFVILPEGIAALNYYLPSDSRPYSVTCKVADKYTNYTRGAATYYVIFTPETAEGKDFKLKVSSSDYRTAAPGKHMSLTMRRGALGYPIIVR